MKLLLPLIVVLMFFPLFENKAETITLRVENNGVLAQQNTVINLDNPKVEKTKNTQSNNESNILLLLGTGLLSFALILKKCTTTAAKK